MQSNVDYVLKAVKNNPLVIKYVPKILLENNKEISIVALNNYKYSKNFYVKKNYRELKYYIPKKYRDDEDIQLLLSNM